MLKARPKNMIEEKTLQFRILQMSLDGAGLRIENLYLRPTWNRAGPYVDGST